MRISDLSSDVCSSDLSNSAEAEDTGDDRHDEEHKSPVKHGRPPESFAAWRQPRGDTAGCRGNAPSAGWVPIEDAAADGRGSSSCSARSEEHTSELQSLMRISYAVFCLKKKNPQPPSTRKSPQPDQT